jgi:hypothetical protein
VKTSKVTERAIAMMKGMQGKGCFLQENIFRSRDTETDSIKDYQQLIFSTRLEVMEFYPYKKNV